MPRLELIISKKQSQKLAQLAINRVNIAIKKFLVEFAKEVQNEFINVDSTSVTLRNGRAVVKGESVVPLIVDDKGGAAKFSIESKVDWIKVDDSELSSDKIEKRIYLYFTSHFNRNFSRHKFTNLKLEVS